MVQMETSLLNSFSIQQLYEANASEVHFKALDALWVHPLSTITVLSMQATVNREQMK